MSERWLLPPLWFDLCWEIGGFDEYPFPIAVRSHGATLEERAVLKQRAIPEMEAAGVIGGGFLNPRFGQVLAQIAKPGLWIEGLWTVDDVEPSPTRLMSVVAEDASILFVQGPGETERLGGDVQITVHPRTSVSAAVLSGMPPTPPGNRARTAVPVSALAPGGGNDDEEEEIDVMRPNRSSPDERGANAFKEIVETEHLRDGQFTANLRDRSGSPRRSAPFKWFDAFEPDGRYGVSEQHRPGNEAELVVAPLGAGEIRTALDNRVQQVRSGN
ncbi:ESX secretion-associated protein EspG [Parasphingorhabdus pacifica]